MPKNKFNVLFVAQVPIDPFKGGVQNVTHILSQEMRRRGCEVSYLCLGTEKAEYDFIENQYYLPSVDELLSTGNIHFVSKILEDLKITHIINQAGFYSHVMDFYKALALSNIPIYTVHHNCLKCLNDRYREIRLSNTSRSARILKKIDYAPIWFVLKFMNRYKYSRMIKRAIIESERFVLLSSAYIPELEHYWIDDKYLSRVTAIYNPLAVETSTPSLTNKENRILFVGRLEIAQKRVDRLMDIWLEIHKLHPDWFFDVVGDGGARAFMEDFVEKNNMQNVVFHGKCDPKPHLSKASIFTMTSDFEGWPMVLTEALHYGVVPVAFNSFGSLKEIIEDGHTGLIVPAFDNKRYVELLSDIMLFDKKRNQMAVSAQESLNRFVPTVIVNNWFNLFSDKL